MSQNSFLYVCPVCGFSFKYFNKDLGDKAVKCPMCGFQISQKLTEHNKQDKFDNKFF